MKNYQEVKFFVGEDKHPIPNMTITCTNFGAFYPFGQIVENDLAKIGITCKKEETSSIPELGYSRINVYLDELTEDVYNVLEDIKKLADSSNESDDEASGY